ncbi:MAG: heparan N-sulfatase [Planctomycetia bacterium]|nr:heparan N-sulfatase [Planctomycetia bacterium]
MVAPQRSPAAVADRPNVILIIADDVSWDDLGCYGNASARTPHIDRLADRGRRFDHAYLTASSCSPSRASIVTGRYPHNLGGASELHLPIAAHLPWFPRLLRDAGYFTGLVGKNHMVADSPAAGSHPQPNPFDLVESGKAQGNSGGHATWVDALRHRPQGKPFFFWFAAYDAHRDWDGDAEWRDAQYGPTHDPLHVRVPAAMIDDLPTRADLASFQNEVTRFDHFVGEVIRELELQSILDTTCVIVMADNGRPFPRAKTRLHDAGMKTPFVVHWPDAIRSPGVATTSLISAIDIAPTILAAAGITPPVTMQGVSFLPLLHEPMATVRRHAFSEHNWHDYEAHGRAVRSEGYLYIRNRRPALGWEGPADSVGSAAHRSLLSARIAGELSPVQADVLVAPRPAEELYRTNDDPEQIRNLVDDPAHAGAVARLRRLLDDWIETTHDSCPEAISRDAYDRQTGRALEIPSDAYRGTPPGSDRDAAAVDAPGPR